MHGPLNVKFERQKHNWI